MSSSEDSPTRSNQSFDVDNDDNFSDRLEPDSVKFGFAPVAVATTMAGSTTSAPTPTLAATSTFAAATTSAPTPTPASATTFAAATTSAPTLTLASTITFATAFTYAAATTTAAAPTVSVPAHLQAPIKRCRPNKRKRPACNIGVNFSPPSSSPLGYRSLLRYHAVASIDTGGCQRLADLLSRCDLYSDDILIRSPTPTQHQTDIADIDFLISRAHRGS